jgi:hypothetical protein
MFITLSQGEVMSEVKIGMELKKSKHKIDWIKTPLKNEKARGTPRANSPIGNSQSM